MKNNNILSEEELKQVKHIQETKQETKEGILFNTNLLTRKEAKKIDRSKEKVIIYLIGGDKTSIYSRKQFNKILLKNPKHRDITFIEDFYNEMYRLTGLEKSKDHPHYKPNIFAEYTIKYIYGRFKIKNLMDELRERNPFLTHELFREFKHYYLLNEENYDKLVVFINDAINYMRKFENKNMFKFDVEYCKEYGIKNNEDLFYKGK